jgi:hypothetical protein
MPIDFRNTRDKRIKAITDEAEKHGVPRDEALKMAEARMAISSISRPARASGPVIWRRWRSAERRSPSRRRRAHWASASARRRSGS